MPAPCISSTLNTAVNSGCSSQLAGVESTAVLIPLSLIDRATLAFDADSVIVNALSLIGAGKGVEITVKGDMPYSDMAINGTMGTYVQLFEAVFAFLSLRIPLQQLNRLCSSEMISM